ncbi:MAG: hypothetical protein ACRDA3_06130 [Peptostreptococcaceae bacterium]
MKTNSMFCSLSKKCKEEYSKEISEKLAREEEYLEEVYKKELTEKNSK